jgi:hypothetical protein
MNASRADTGDIKKWSEHEVFAVDCRIVSWSQYKQPRLGQQQLDGITFAVLFSLSLIRGQGWGGNCSDNNSRNEPLSNCFRQSVTRGATQTFLGRNFRRDKNFFFFFFPNRQVSFPFFWTVYPRAVTTRPLPSKKEKKDDRCVRIINLPLFLLPLSWYHQKRKRLNKDVQSWQMPGPERECVCVCAYVELLLLLFKALNKGGEFLTSDGTIGKRNRMPGQF